MRSFGIRAIPLGAVVAILAAGCAATAPAGPPRCESIGLRNIGRSDPSVRYDPASGQYVHCPRYGALGLSGPRAEDCVDGSMACVVP